MKRYFYFLFALCVGAVVMSCKPNNDINDPNKYVVMAKLHTIDNPSDDASYEKIVAAMTAGGYAPDKKVEIHIGDTTQMSADLKAFAQKVRSDVGDITGYFQIELTGCQALYADQNDKEHPWKVYDIVSIGTPTNSDRVYYFAQYKAGWFFLDYEWYRDAWVYGIKTNDYYDTNTSDSHAFQANIDLNVGAGGETIVPVLITDGHGNWNSSNKYITDVIAVYGGGEPAELKINGRTYKKACHKDLNADAGGKYIWFYATYDYYDGRYLWLGGVHEDSGDLSCRVLTSGFDLKPEKHLKSPWNKNGYDVVERIVPAYDTKGNFVEHAEFNRGAGGSDIKIILSYRKH